MKDTVKIKFDKRSLLFGAMHREILKNRPSSANESVVRILDIVGDKCDEEGYPRLFQEFRGDGWIPVEVPEDDARDAVRWHGEVSNTSYTEDPNVSAAVAFSEPFFHQIRGQLEEE